MAREIELREVKGPAQKITEAAPTLRILGEPMQPNEPVPYRRWLGGCDIRQRFTRFGHVEHADSLAALPLRPTVFEHYPFGPMRSVVPQPIPVVDDPIAHLDHKPRHRGRLHQAAFLVSVPAVVALCVKATTTAGLVSSAIYGSSISGLLLTSSLYNRLAGTPRLKSWMRWLDHSMIYVLIAGSYTPVCWLALERRWSIAILSVVWMGALGGIVLKMTKLRRFRRVGGALYLAIGWFAVIALPKLLPALQPTARLYLVAGGFLYMFGAVLLWLRRPNPSIDFGYHEVWHGFVVIAAACHFAMTWITVAELG